MCEVTLHILISLLSAVPTSCIDSKMMLAVAVSTRMSKIKENATAIVYKTLAILCFFSVI